MLCVGRYCISNFYKIMLYQSPDGEIWDDLIINLCVYICNYVQGEFTDDSTETHFAVGTHECCIKATSSEKKRTGVMHTLFVDGTKVM